MSSLHKYQDVRTFREHVAVLEKVLVGDEERAERAPMSNHVHEPRGRTMGIA